MRCVDNVGYKCGVAESSTAPNRLLWPTRLLYLNTPVKGGEARKQPSLRLNIIFA